MNQHIHSVIFCLLLYFFTQELKAQQNKLLLCTEYNQDGTYKGAYETWAIEKGGNFMYLFLSSQSPLNDTVFIKIEKTFNRKDPGYLYYDHYYLVPDASKKWAANKYTFTKTGNYKISAYDRSNHLLASHTTTVALSPNAYDDMYFRDTWYYSSSVIDFFEKTSGDTMIGKNNIFPYDSSGKKVILYIGQTNKNPFKTNHLRVNIYNDDKCRELINTFTYFVDENWYWTYLSVVLKDKGKYLLEIYNDDDVYINSGKLEIR